MAERPTLAEARTLRREALDQWCACVPGVAQARALRAVYYRLDATCKELEKETT